MLWNQISLLVWNCHSLSSLAQRSHVSEPGKSHNGRIKPQGNIWAFGWELCVILLVMRQYPLWMKKVSRRRFWGLAGPWEKAIWESLCISLLISQVLNTDSSCSVRFYDNSLREHCIHTSSLSGHTAWKVRWYILLTWQFIVESLCENTALCFGKFCFVGLSILSVCRRETHFSLQNVYWWTGILVPCYFSTTCVCVCVCDLVLTWKQFNFILYICVCTHTHTHTHTHTLLILNNSSLILYWYIITAYISCSLLGTY